jgi:hypothetical protein
MVFFLVPQSLQLLFVSKWPLRFGTSIMDPHVAVTRVRAVLWKLGSLVLDSATIVMTAAL